MYLKIEFSKDQKFSVNDIWDELHSIVNSKHMHETRLDEDETDDLFTVKIHYHDEYLSDEDIYDKLQNIKKDISIEFDTKNIKYYWRN